MVLIENKTNQIVFLKEESETLVSCVLGLFSSSHKCHILSSVRFMFFVCLCFLLDICLLTWFFAKQIILAVFYLLLNLFTAFLIFLAVLFIIIFPFFSIWLCYIPTHNCFSSFVLFEMIKACL